MFFFLCKIICLTGFHSNPSGFQLLNILLHKKIPLKKLMYDFNSTAFGKVDL